MNSKRGSKLHSIIEKLSEQFGRMDDSPPENQESNIDTTQITIVHPEPPKQRKSKSTGAKRQSNKTVQRIKQKSGIQTSKQANTLVNSCHRVDEDLCIDVNSLVCITPQVKDIEAEHNYVDRSTSEHVCQLCFKVTNSSADLVDHCKTSHSTVYQEAFSSEPEQEDDDSEAFVDDCDLDYDPISDPENLRSKIGNSGSVRRQSARLRSKNSDSTNKAKNSKEKDAASGPDNHELNKNYRCEFCDKDFVCEVQLIDHMTTMHPNSGNGNCKGRGSEEHTSQKEKHNTSRNDLLVEGNQTKDDPSLECKECFKKFTTTRRQHLHLTNNLADKPVTCELCGKQFQYNCSLKRHMNRPCPMKKSDHFETQCEICGKQFRRRDYFLLHKKIHLGIKKYQCEYCEKSFTHQGTLKTHLMLHTGERPFKCLQCDASFINRTSLRDHENRRHTGFMPYPCSMCPKKFLKSNHLKTHILSHSTEKPFPCKVCGKAFKRRDHLRIHQVIHSNDKPFKCDTCGRTFNQRICLTKHLPCRELEKHNKKLNRAKEIKPKKTMSSSKEDEASSEIENKVPESSAVSREKIPTINVQTDSKEYNTEHQTDSLLNNSAAEEQSRDNSASPEIQATDRGNSEMQVQNSVESSIVNLNASQNQLDSETLACATENSSLHPTNINDTDTAVRENHNNAMTLDKLDFTNGFPGPETSIQVSTMGSFNLPCAYSSSIPQNYTPFNCDNTGSVHVYESGSLGLDSMQVGSHDNMLGNQAFNPGNANDLGSALFAAIDPDHLNTMTTTPAIFPAVIDQHL